MKVKNFNDTIQWYTQNADYYANQSINAFSVNDKNQLEQFSSKLKNRGLILDAGCGSGRDSDWLTKKGFKTIGIDLSEGLIKYAQNTFPQCKFLLGNFISTSFQNNYFDGIWAHASLLHLETVQEVKNAIKEFYRILKNKGLLHILVKAQKDNLKTSIVKDKLSNHNRFFQYFSLQEIRDLVRRGGFDVEYINQYNESDNNPQGRPEVDWIVLLATKP